MRVTITGENEPNPDGNGVWTGYISVTVENDGELLAAVTVAPEVLERVGGNPEKLREPGEQLGQTAEVLDQR